MKILVMSDSHGSNQTLERIMQLHEDADLMIHCGDIETSEYAYPNLKTVRGNNDLYYDYPEKLILSIAGHRILVVHGNQCYFYNRVAFFTKMAKEADCDIVCYGHTHVAQLDEEDGITLLNPGSIWHSRDGRAPSYALMYLEGADVRIEFKFI